ncbi:MAG: BolA/IbaG family iron-sulfur metabolism protein [Gammaproteobacteria bacterium]
MAIVINRDLDMQSKELEALIRAGIPGAEVVVKGEGDHFEATVISDRFENCTMVKQHQLVYGTLGDRMGGEIHALALRTYTRDQWRSQRRIQ